MKYSNVFKLSVLLLAQMLLPIVSQNIPSPLSSFYLYSLILIIGIIVYKAKVIVTSINGRVWFFAGFYLLLFITGIYDISHKTYNFSFIILKELLPIYICSTLLIYFITAENTERLISIVRILMVFLIITLITCNIGLTFAPDAARMISGKLGAEGEFELLQQYQKMGIAGYDFYYGLAYIMPVFIFVLSKHWKNIRQRLIISSFILLTFYTIIKAQMATAVLFAVMLSILSLFGVLSKKLVSRKKIIILLIVVVPFIFVPGSVYVSVLQVMAKIAPGDILKSRLSDLSVAIEYFDQGIEESETHVSQRSERLPYLWENFKSSPIIGGGESTGHNFWLDRMSLFGLIGMIPWILLYYSILQTVSSRLNEETKYYWILVFTAVISIGFIKNSGGKLMYLFVIFLAPAILNIYSNDRAIFKNHK